MLKYKYIRILFLIAGMIVIAGRIIFEWDIIWMVPVLLLIYLGLIAWGSYFIHSGYFLDATCKVKSSRREIALTFDDGPVRSVTPAVLDLLKDYDAKATFFCIGKNLKGNEDIISRIKNEGHTLGNHSWSHSFFFDFFHDRKVEEELLRTNVEMEKISGFEVKYFRPPFGVTNPVIARVVLKLKLPVIGWSIRSLDTTIRNPDQLFKRVTRKLEPGDIVLFHDSHARILPVLKLFLEFTRHHDYKAVGITELLENY